MDELNARRLRKPDAECANCGSATALRFTDSMARITATRAASVVLFTYQCHNCGHVYELTARAFRVSQWKRAA